MSRRGRLGYLCLQATREGQASHAHVHEIVKGLRELGWVVDLHEPGYANRDQEPGIWLRLSEFVRVQTAFVRRMRDWDAVYVRSHFAALPSVAAAKLLGVPMVREVNGTYQDLFIAWPLTRAMAPVFRWMMRLQLRWTDAVITVTPGLADWIRDASGSEEVFVVPNAADTDLFSPDSATDHDLPARYVVFFGALAPWQGIDTLLEAIRRPEWPQSTDLVIAGDGALRNQVEAAAATDDRVLYLGTIPYRDVPGLVAGSVAGLSPQGHGEGRSEKGLSPLKVFETMACGVPVVVTDHPGQSDLVRSEGCGIVVSVDDPVALARAVSRLAEDPELVEEMGGRGRTAAVRDHSWRQRATDTDRILKGLVAAP